MFSSSHKPLVDDLGCIVPARINVDAFLHNRVGPSTERLANFVPAGLDLRRLVWLSHSDAVSDVGSSAACESRICAGRGLGLPISTSRGSRGGSTSTDTPQSRIRGDAELGSRLRMQLLHKIGSNEHSKHQACRNVLSSGVLSPVPTVTGFGAEAILTMRACGLFWPCVFGERGGGGYIPVGCRTGTAVRHSGSLCCGWWWGWRTGATGRRSSRLLPLDTSLSRFFPWVTDSYVDGKRPCELQTCRFMLMYPGPRTLSFLSEPCSRSPTRGQFTSSDRSRFVDTVKAHLKQASCLHIFLSCKGFHDKT